MWFSSMPLGTSGKSLLKYCFFLKKRIKFEPIRNITHQMNSLRESFIPQKRATEAFHYPGYVTRLQKEQQIQANAKNLHEKVCTKTMSHRSINIKLIIKSNKSLRLLFLQVTAFVSQMTSNIVILWKENKNLQKREQICKNRENWF